MRAPQECCGTGSDPADRTVEWVDDHQPGAAGPGTVPHRGDDCCSDGVGDLREDVGPGDKSMSRRGRATRQPQERRHRIKRRVVASTRHHPDGRRDVGRDAATRAGRADEQHRTGDATPSIGTDVDVRPRRRFSDRKPAPPPRYHRGRRRGWKVHGHNVFANRWRGAEGQRRDDPEVPATSAAQRPVEVVPFSWRNGDSFPVGQHHRRGGEGVTGEPV